MVWTALVPAYLTAITEPHSNASLPLFKRRPVRYAPVNAVYTATRARVWFVVAFERFHATSVGFCVSVVWCHGGCLLVVLHKIERYDVDKHERQYGRACYECPQRVHSDAPPCVSDAFVLLKYEFDCATLPLVRVV